MEVPPTTHRVMLLFFTDMTVTATTLTATSELEDDTSPEEAEQMISWLRHNIAPKERVRECMRKTAISRYWNLSSNPELTIKSVLASNPRLLDPGMVSTLWD